MYGAIFFRLGVLRAKHNLRSLLQKEYSQQNITFHKNQASHLYATHFPPRDGKRQALPPQAYIGSQNSTTCACCSKTLNTALDKTCPNCQACLDCNMKTLCPKVTRENFLKLPLTLRVALRKSQTLTEKERHDGKTAPAHIMIPPPLHNNPPSITNSPLPQHSPH